LFYGGSVDPSSDVLAVDVNYFLRAGRQRRSSVSSQAEENVSGSFRSPRGGRKPLEIFEVEEVGYILDSRRVKVATVHIYRCHSLQTRERDHQETEESTGGTDSVVGHGTFTYSILRGGLVL